MGAGGGVRRGAPRARQSGFVGILRRGGTRRRGSAQDQIRGHSTGAGVSVPAGPFGEGGDVVFAGRFGGSGHRFDGISSDAPDSRRLRHLLRPPQVILFRRRENMPGPNRGLRGQKKPRCRFAGKVARTQSSLRCVMHYFYRLSLSLSLSALYLGSLSLGRIRGKKKRKKTFFFTSYHLPFLVALFTVDYIH